MDEVVELTKSSKLGSSSHLLIYHISLGFLFRNLTEVENHGFSTELIQIAPRKIYRDPKYYSLEVRNIKPKTSPNLVINQRRWAEQSGVCAA